MKKKIVVIILLTISLSLYSSKIDIQNINYNDNEISEYELKERIYNRTIDDLKKFGIKKFLLYNNGYWIGEGVSVNLLLSFKENGFLYINHAGRAFDKLLWKVVNNKLYINPFTKYDRDNKLNKFFLTKIKPVREFSVGIGPSSDRNKYLKRAQYVIDIESIEKVKYKDGSWYHAVDYRLKTYKTGTEGSTPPRGLFPED